MENNNNKENQIKIDFYEYFLSNEYREWLKRIFIYPLDYQSRIIAKIEEDMGIDYFNLSVFLYVIKSFLKENNNDITYIEKGHQKSTYNILEGSSFITIDILEDLKDKNKTSYIVSTSCNIDIITKKTLSLDILKEYAEAKLNKEERSRQK